MTHGHRAAPVLDFAHLDRQTFGDAGLQREVLTLFLEQLRATREIGAPAGDERRAALHRLKGAARGVGAFALADEAERLEAEPDRAPEAFRAALAAAEAAVSARLAALVSQG